MDKSHKKQTGTLIPHKCNISSTCSTFQCIPMHHRTRSNTEKGAAVIWLFIYHFWQTKVIIPANVWQCFSSFFLLSQQVGNRSVIQSAANFNIQSLADFFPGNKTEVMLSKTCGSLNTINSGPECEKTASISVKQRNSDSTMCSVFMSLSIIYLKIIMFHNLLQVQWKKMSSFV